jgi:hypothetical protein
LEDFQMKINTTKYALMTALAGAMLAGPAAAITINPSADALARQQTVGGYTAPLESHSTDLAVGPVSGSDDYFRTYLAFDLSGESLATDATLTMKGAPVTGEFAGVENNDLALTQTFTLFVTTGDWNNAASMPGGTDIATTDLDVTTGNDTQDLVFTGTALKDAFNSAVGGMLYLGIRSSGETLAPAASDRSFKWFTHSEDATGGPDLDYTPVPEPGSLALLGLGGLLIARRRRG